MASVRLVPGERRLIISRKWKAMKHRDKSEFDPTDDASPTDSEDAFSRGAGSAAEDDYDVEDAPVTSAQADGQTTDLSRQLSDSRDKYLRLAAEYDNYRKRTARERAEL